jgi:hypothetical protein
MKSNDKNPWIDSANDNWLSKEIEIIKDRVYLANHKPNPAIQWLCKNNQQKKIFKTLSELAPVFPLNAYHDEPSLWLAPPISGSGNQIVVVVGKNQGGIRMVGCNFCNVNLQPTGSKTINNFWSDYDSFASDLDKYRLMSKFVSENFDQASLSQAKNVDNQCYDYRTMPLYVVCIDSKQVHVWSMPCIIWPALRPSKMSHELVKEF